MKALSLWLLFGTPICKAETIGWKVPLDLVLPPDVREGKVRVLDEHPEESAFFEEGEVLLDLSGAFEVVDPDAIELIVSEPVEGKGDVFDDPFGRGSTTQERGTPSIVFGDPIPFYGDWIVWSERLGMIVAKGDWAALSAVHEVIAIEYAPCRVRNKMAVRRGGEIVASYKVTSRSGERVTVKTEAGSFDLAPNLSRSKRIVDHQFYFEHEIREDTRLVLSTAVVWRTGELLEVAHYVDKDGERWDFELLVTTHGIGGEALTDHVWFEQKEKLISVHPDEIVTGIASRGLGEDLILRTHLAPFDTLGHVGSQLPAEQWKLFTPPESLRTLLPAGGVDMTDLLSQWGFNLKGDSFAVFYQSNSTVVVVGDAHSQDLVESRFMPLDGCWFPAPVKLSLEWGDRACGLVMRSGEKSSLGLREGVVRKELFEFTPYLGPNNQTVELYHVLQPEPGKRWTGETASILGVEYELAERVMKGKREVLQMRAELLEESHSHSD